MREALFIKKNAQKWNEYQYLQTEDPDQMADRFITLLDDLSYAKTFYPHSKVTRWINSLAVSIYQTIYQNKKQRFSRLITFWQYELPLMFRKYHRMLLYTFLIFILFCSMAVLSSMNDDNFVKGFLGPERVAKLEEDIDKGDPFGFYGKDNRFSMFIHIAYHNSVVSFRMIIGGVTFGIWTFWNFMQHGFLLGCFQYLFFAKGVGWQSILVVWIHGTLEVSQWIISATAGFIIAKGILFPGTYTRWISFKTRVKDAMKICICLIPITIAAAFLEGYITRLMSNTFDNTNSIGIPIWSSICIISFSFLFIVWYFVIYPIRLEKRIKNDSALAAKISA